MPDADKYFVEHIAQIPRVPVEIALSEKVLGGRSLEVNPVSQQNVHKKVYGFLTAVRIFDFDPSKLVWFLKASLRDCSVKKLVLIYFSMKLQFHEQELGRPSTSLGTLNP